MRSLLNFPLVRPFLTCSYSLSFSLFYTLQASTMRLQRCSNLWLLPFASFLFVTVSAKDTLSISSFQDCQSDADINVKKMNIDYNNSDKTIIFDVAGTSTKSQNVTAKLKVEAYGKDVYTKDFNPCDASTFVAGLCPGKRIVHDIRDRS